MYGCEVNDFHTISKEYIFTINVCATQQLHRIILQQHAKISELENTISSIMTRLEAGGL